MRFSDVLCAWSSCLRAFGAEDKSLISQCQVRGRLYGQGLRADYHLCYFATGEERPELSSMMGVG
jgi:hypothetical protein